MKDGFMREGVMEKDHDALKFWIKLFNLFSYFLFLIICMR